MNAPTTAPATTASKKRRQSKKPSTTKVISNSIQSGSTTPAQLETPPPAYTPTTAESEQTAKSLGFSGVKFNDFLTSGKISSQVAAGIPFEFCTEVQAKTLPIILTGVDVLAQAKTGTGKTVAFLVPSIERLVRGYAVEKGKISILILSPTRELAIQIEEEARKLCSGTDFVVQHVVGGTNMSSETKRLNSRCDILVGTPGRMIDHLENSNLKIKLSNVKSLILDEADRLLEAGFRKELIKIIGCLPDRKVVSRQSLLFSATVPAQVHQIASIALLPNFSFVTTISEGDAGTHSRVPQHHLTAPLIDIIPLTLSAIKSEIKIHAKTTKIMCFLPTARATGLFAAVFKRLNTGLEVFEIHSRKSQSQRNSAAEAFKNSTAAILFSSDVTARGMDFPGVTTVIQVGLPANPEQYIHRLGRTARAGAAGSGILILAPWESFFLRKGEIVALGVGLHPEVKGDLNLNGAGVEESRKAVAGVMGSVDDEVKAQFYSATLGFYKPFIRDCFGSAEKMVETMNEYVSAENGLNYNGNEQKIPGMLASTVGKMGLRGTKGLVIIHALPPKANGSGAPPPNRGGGGGRGGGAGRGRGASRGGAGRGRGRGN